MGRMFKSVSETRNYVTGCLHGCVYCYARRLANGRLKERYLANINGISPYERDGTHLIIYPSDDKLNDPFYPRLWPSRLKKGFKAGILVFVVDMGDLFGSWVPREWILRVIEHIKKYPGTTFLFLTKNPERYHEFEFPENAILGVTLETDRHYIDISNAPSPLSRFKEILTHSHPRKFVSIEPILSFNMDKLVTIVEAIHPELIEVGADNYGFNLPEPTWSMVEGLLGRLRDICPKVVEKDGLKRLR